MAAKPQIRWLIRRDMGDVLNIEHACFKYPWTEEEFLHCLRQRNCVGMVAELNQQVVGFMVYELHRTRLNLLSFAVAPKYQRRGIGTAMVLKLQDKLTQQRRAQITLEVRETNLPAQLFFRSHGFKATGVIRDRYDDCTEDAYAMRYSIEPQHGNRVASLLEDVA